MYQASIRNKKSKVDFNRDKGINYTIDNEFEEYAYVIKLLGNCRASVISNSGVNSIGIIRGTLRKFNKRIMIENGDIVVISKRDFQDNKVDIVHKFNLDQSKNLVKNKELSNILITYYNNKKSDIVIEDIEDDIKYEFDEINLNNKSDKSDNTTKTVKKNRVVNGYFEVDISSDESDIYEEDDKV
jgi:translation initiation factor 1A